MEQTSKLYHARCRIWANLPSAPATFGDCQRKCGRGLGGRSGGPCLLCAQDDLAEIVGAPNAEAYVKAIRLVRELEREQDDTYDD